MATRNPTSVSEQIAELIRRQITEGVLRPGDRIPAERELATELGAARSAVREALRELRAQGFLVAGKGRQPSVVASLADSGIGEPLAQLLRAGKGQLLDLIELRRGLEVQAAGLAARRRANEDLAAIRDILLMMRGNVERTRSAQLDAAFHGTVAQATHNVFYMHVTAELVGLLQEHIPPILDILYTESSSSEDLLEQHHAILEAIEAQDEEAARQAMAEHLGYVVEGIERVSGQPDGDGTGTAREAEEALTAPVSGQFLADPGPGFWLKRDPVS